MAFGKPPPKTNEGINMLGQLAEHAEALLMEQQETTDDDWEPEPDDDWDEYDFDADDDADGFDDLEFDEPEASAPPVFAADFGADAFTQAMSAQSLKPKAATKPAAQEPERIAYTRDPSIPESSVEEVASHTAAAFLESTFKEASAGNIAEYTFYLDPTKTHDEVNRYVKAMRQGVVRVRNAAVKMGRNVPDFVVAQIAIEQTDTGYWVITMARMSRDQHTDYIAARKASEQEVQIDKLVNYL